MTSEQIKLRLAFDAAFTRHYRSVLDAARTTPALLDDLVAVAETYATEHARRVTARQALRAEAAAPPLVAASPDEPAVVVMQPDVLTAANMPPSPSHRTRTRTRRTAD